MTNPGEILNPSEGIAEPVRRERVRSSPTQRRRISRFVTGRRQEAIPVVGRGSPLPQTECPPPFQLRQSGLRREFTVRNPVVNRCSLPIFSRPSSRGYD